MAITVEQISKVLAGDGDVTEAIQEKASVLFSAYEDDVKGLKGVNADLKAEKQKIQAAHQADIEKFTQTEKDYQSKIAVYEEQLKANSPEDTKKYFEKQRADDQALFQAQISQKNKTIEEMTAQVAQFKKEDNIRSQQAEFMREISKTKADPVMYGVLETMIIGSEGNRFQKHNNGGGTGDFYLATDGSGETIKNRIDSFLNGDMGKHFISFGSSGSGAEGGTVKTVGNGENPFITGNYEDQARLYHEDPKLFSIYKEQARKARK